MLSHQRNGLLQIPILQPSCRFQEPGCFLQILREMRRTRFVNCTILATTILLCVILGADGYLVICVPARVNHAGSSSSIAEKQHNLPRRLPGRKGIYYSNSKQETIYQYLPRVRHITQTQSPSTSEDTTATTPHPHSHNPSV